ncbi:MAG: hypothetical protein M5U26_26100 [Planctomycetota bacterium]|nr:hypothetical protein [Planctomycetota bacterium]
MAAEPGSLLLKAALKGEWAVKESKAGEVTCVDGVKLVALMFLSLYQALNLARRVSHPG